MSYGSGESASGLRALKKRQTRALLMDAVITLCATQTFEETTVDQIAAAAAVSTRTFSRYFATKEAVGLALLDEIFEAFGLEISRQPDEIGIFQALRDGCVTALERTIRTSHGGLTAARLLRVVQILISSPALQQAAADYRTNAVDGVLAARLGVPTDHPQVRSVFAVWGAILRVSLQRTPARAAAPDRRRIHDIADAIKATYGELEAVGYPFRAQPPTDENASGQR